MAQGQISASVGESVENDVISIAENENRTFSAMVKILLEEAIKARVKKGKK